VRKLSRNKKSTMSDLDIRDIRKSIPESSKTMKRSENKVSMKSGKTKAIVSTKSTKLGKMKAVCVLKSKIDEVIDKSKKEKENIVNDHEGNMDMDIRQYAHSNISMIEKRMICNW